MLYAMLASQLALVLSCCSRVLCSSSRRIYYAFLTLDYGIAEPRNQPKIKGADATNRNLILVPIVIGILMF
jgi:hypothetical protein